MSNPERTQITVEPGNYLHHKGKTYTVIGMALNVDGPKPAPMVLYWGEKDGPNVLFVRSVEGFTQNVYVTRDGQSVLAPRFKRLEG